MQQQDARRFAVVAYLHSYSRLPCCLGPPPASGVGYRYQVPPVVSRPAMKRRRELRIVVQSLAVVEMPAPRLTRQGSETAEPVGPQGNNPVVGTLALHLDSDAPANERGGKPPDCRNDLRAPRRKLARLVVVANGADHKPQRPAVSRIQNAAQIFIPFQKTVGLVNQQSRLPFLDADLTEAALSFANLSSANLSGANLTGADLIKADLIEADLGGAVLTETIFGDTNLSGAKRLEYCRHYGPSTVDHRTLAKSGKLPLEFLRGLGLTDFIIDNIAVLQGDPIEFYSCFISYSRHDSEFADRLLHRPDGNDVARCPPDHLLSFFPHGFDITIGLVDGNDRRLIDNDPLASDRDQGIDRAKIDGQVSRENAEERTKIHRSLPVFRVSYSPIAVCTQGSVDP